MSLPPLMTREASALRETESTARLWESSSSSAPATSRSIATGVMTSGLGPAPPPRACTLQQRGVRSVPGPLVRCRQCAASGVQRGNLYTKLWLSGLTGRCHKPTLPSKLAVATNSPAQRAVGQLAVCPARVARWAA